VAVRRRGRGQKSVFASVAIKSFDFLVYSDCSPRTCCVDVKGRKFPTAAATAGPAAGRGRNWVTRVTSKSLLEWQNIFGKDFRAVLVFAYWLQGRRRGRPFEDVHFFRNRYYAFAAIAMASTRPPAAPAAPAGRR